MKKTLSVLIIMMMLFSSIALTACGGDKKTDLSNSKYLGKWEASALSLGDLSENVDESSELNETTMTLLADGTGHMDGDGEVSNFTWSEIDGGFKTKGDLKATFKDEEGGIKAKIIGVDLHFVKVEE